MLKEVFYDITRGVSHAIVISAIATAFLGLVLFSVINLVKDNFEPIYFLIGTAITLSGFTMLSGIFSKNKKTEVEKNLFSLSIIFLISAFSFILFIGLYIITKGIDNPTWQEKILIYLSTIAYYIGMVPFLLGFAFLLIVLVKYRKQIDV